MILRPYTKLGSTKARPGRTRMWTASKSFCQASLQDSPQLCLYSGYPKPLQDRQFVMPKKRAHLWKSKDTSSKPWEARALLDSYGLKWTSKGFKASWLPPIASDCWVWRGTGSRIYAKATSISGFSNKKHLHKLVRKNHNAYQPFLRIWNFENFGTNLSASGRGWVVG